MAVIALSSHQRLQADLQACLGPDVAVVCTGLDGDPETLWPEERAAISRAVPKRQREFAAGRRAARAAMQRLNWPAVSIPAHSDRSPCWPEGLVGSIAHSADTCVAVVGRQALWESIGIDIEPDRGIEEPLWGIICAPDELRQLGERDPTSLASLMTRVFVAKEAFYKWHYPQHQVFLDFHDVSVRWASNGSGFEVVSGATAGCERVFQGNGQILHLGGNVVGSFASAVPSR